MSDTVEKLTNRRGRVYNLAPLPGFADRGVAYAAAILDEARERCVDLICDMTEAALWTRPAGCPFAAGDLVLHMNWAEYLWLPKIGPHRLAAETAATIERGNLSRLYDPQPGAIAAGDLVALCRETRTDLVIPCLQAATAIDLPIASHLPGGKGPATVREILMHVTTSWLYHSGQVGLLTLQNGIDYTWGF